MEASRTGAPEPAGGRLRGYEGLNSRPWLGALREGGQREPGPRLLQSHGHFPASSPQWRAQAQGRHFGTRGQMGAGYPPEGSEAWPDPNGACQGPKSADLRYRWPDSVAIYFRPPGSPDSHSAVSEFRGPERFPRSGEAGSAEI